MLDLLARFAWGMVAIIGLILVAMGDVKGAAMVVGSVLLADLLLHKLRRAVAWILRWPGKSGRW